MTAGTDIDTKNLRVFVEIVRAGAISGAAVSLGLSQGAVSARLKRLEERVGAPLFMRGRRGWQTELTAAGHDLLADAEAMVALHDRMVARCRARPWKHW